LVDVALLVLRSPDAAELGEGAEGRAFEFVKIVVKFVAGLYEAGSFCVYSQLDFAGHFVVEFYVYQDIVVAGA
jgi:hypothetical protein